MAQRSGTHRRPLDIPSCPIVQLHGTDSEVGCIGVYYSKVHIVPEVLVGPMDIHFGQRNSDGKLEHHSIFFISFSPSLAPMPSTSLPFLAPSGQSGEGLYRKGWPCSSRHCKDEYRNL